MWHPGQPENALFKERCPMFIKKIWVNNTKYGNVGLPVLSGRGNHGDLPGKSYEEIPGESGFSMGATKGSPKLEEMKNIGKADKEKLSSIFFIAPLKSSGSSVSRTVP
jgi:hypothetical protein